MKQLEELLANRRIPGEVHHRRVDLSLQEELSATDPSVEEVSNHGNQTMVSELCMKDGESLCG